MTTVSGLHIPRDQLKRAWMCAQVGWRVFPITPGTKTPAMSKWPERATTDWSIIQEWWMQRYRRCDVGILTGRESGIWVLDIDVHWINGFASARNLFNLHGMPNVPKTFRVGTPSGGQQIYFRYPDDGRKVKNVASTAQRPGPLGAGLDVRGWHGQVVAPEGEGREVVDATLPVADAPNWLVDLVVEKPRTESWTTKITSTEAAMHSAQHLADRLARATEGRNPMLNDIAFQFGILAASGWLDRSDAWNLLYDACQENGSLDGPDAWRNAEGQFEATFNSGWIAGLEQGSKK